MCCSCDILCCVPGCDLRVDSYLTDSISRCMNQPAKQTNEICCCLRSTLITHRKQQPQCDIDGLSPQRNTRSKRKQQQNQHHRTTIATATTALGVYKYLRDELLHTPPTTTISKHICLLITHRIFLFPVLCAGAHSPRPASVVAWADATVIGLLVALGAAHRGGHQDAGRGSGICRYMSWLLLITMVVLHLWLN